MFSLTFKFEDEKKRAVDAYKKAAFRNIPHALASIRRDAMKLVERDAEASQPGEPVHTRRGLFDRAMRFAYEPDKERGVVGLAFSIAGESGEPHEHGGEFKGQTYPARPFMQPALEMNLSRFASSWEGTIGG
jgi:hypothetical protein